MILGIISLLLFLGTQFPCFFNTFLLTFEFVHLLVFLVAIFYILHALLFIIWMKRIKQTWDNYNKKDLEELKIAFKNKKENSFYFWISSTREAVEFVIGRDLFFEAFDLPQSFNYGKYLRKCLTEKIVGLLVIHPFVWTTLILIVLLNWAFQFKSTGEIAGMIGIICGGFFFFYQF